MSLRRYDEIADQALADLTAEIDVDAYARTMQRARIALGSADWRERLRWLLGRPPATWMYEAAEAQIRMRTQ